MRRCASAWPPTSPAYEPNRAPARADIAAHHDKGLLMAEWSSYRLSDFLMFSPEVYWRLVARYNMAWWPAQLLALAAGAALLMLCRAPALHRRRIALVLLAPAWAWVGWAFQWRRYAEVFIGAPWLAGASALQAVLLLAAVGCAPGDRRTELPPPGPLPSVLLGAALLYPVLAPLTGHPWSEAEVFAFMPAPTALATLGAVAGLRPWPAWSRCVLAVIPVLSLLLAAVTRWLIAS
jgi:hypothetical protein